MNPNQCFAAQIFRLLLVCLLAGLAPVARSQTVFLTNNIDRPLRYTPVGTDFVITNGAEFFNRPLYGGSSPFRMDGGDKPEFFLYLPGRGGNLRLGIKAGGKTKWLNEAAQVVAIYRPSSIIHEVRDPLLGEGVLRLTTLALHKTDGMILRAELTGAKSSVELVWAFGGVNGMKDQRNGDIGCEVEPVGKLFQLRAEQCAGNVVTFSKDGFSVQGKPATIIGITSAKAEMQIADAAKWNRPEELFAATTAKNLQPLLAGRVALNADAPFYLLLQRLTDGGEVSTTDLLKLFVREETIRRDLAERVTVVTPDPFVNAAVAVLNVAADAVWDDRQEAYLHGGVAWRVRLLGWRVSYAGDELGWHERTAEHFSGFAKQQDTHEISAVIPAPETSANLSRNENALHSNGDLTQTHYDMNLIGVDAIFRHLLWTGDLDYAKKMWPTIERHLAWERRLFRREFGEDKLPLYEAYCCIWASDDLAYNGGGATHSSAFNYFENKLAARVAKLIGEDAAPYEREADLILQGMKKNLWLADRAWFAEWKDLLGLQLVHPNAAAWTFYHAVDSEVASPLEAWQMTRFVDTQIARFPLRGAGVPPGNYTMPTTSWMPYTWSLNNVVLAETMHTALGYWQTQRSDGAFPLFKGALLDSMFLGLCPGNVGMTTWFDTARRESQRDFGDGIGAMSRAVVEGLFGVKPDLLAGEIKICPGFPAAWNHAKIRHPDFEFSFLRDGLREIYTLKNNFPKPVKLRLQISALRDDIASVTVNGEPAKWELIENSVGKPTVEIIAAAATKQLVIVEWKGRGIGTPPVLQKAAFNHGEELSAQFEADEMLRVADSQGALDTLVVSKNGFTGRVAGTPGHRTVFAELRQGAMKWWQPVTFEICAAAETVAPMDWIQPVAGKLETVDLSAQFNDQVTQIFKNEYRSPRSPFCSLATPLQGIGSWCHPKETFVVNDSGLRALAAQNGGKIILPDGVPLATPGAANAKNIAFVSQWENYPREITVPLNGKSSRAFLLMAGSTSAMQSRFDNGEVVATYADGTTTRLALENPTTWWPIDQDYFIDDFAFARPEPLPVRINLKTGNIRVLDMADFKSRGGVVPGGAATVLALPLDGKKELKSLTVRAIANEVVIGLMSVTLQR